MNRRQVVMKVMKADEHFRHHDDDDALLTPAERLGMVWAITRQAYAFSPTPVSPPGLSRHVVRVVRRAG